MRKLGAADFFCGVMTLLVALFGALVLTLMRGDTMPLPAFFALTAGLYALMTLLARRLRGTGIQAPAEADAPDRRLFAAAAGLSFAVSLCYLAAFFPGGVSSDTVTQLYQATGQLPLDDWHPALHTLMLGALWRLFAHPAFLLLVQGACYALAVGYAVTTMRRWRMPTPLCLLSALYLSANPAFSNVMAFPWKDCAFAVCALVLAAQLLNIHLSRGQWLRSLPRLAAFAVMLVLCAILRHNGVALSLAAIVFLVISLRGMRMRAAAALAAFALLFAGVKGPLYGAAGVNKHATPLDETIGLPMTALSHIYVNAPESLDGETTAFLETMAPRETYAAHHAPGDWNATKWHVSPLPAQHDYSLAQVFSFALRAGLAEPSLAVEALSGLLRLPLLPAGQAVWRMSPYVDPGAAAFGIERAHQPFLSRALNWLCRTAAHPALSWLCYLPGVPLLLIMLFCVLFSRRRPLSALTIPAMLIAYHLATSLMLSSPTDFRFFLPTMMCMPLALSALLLRPQDAE